MTLKARRNGFSITEIIIVIAIFSTILSFGLLATTDSLKATVFRSERATVLSSLTRARSRAMNNYFETPHGICYSDGITKNYIIFRGTSYIPGSPSNEYINGNSGVKITSSPNNFLCSNGGISFSQITGDTLPITISITEEVRTTNIFINQAGNISW